MELKRMKFRAEEALRQSGLDWRIVRPTAFAELWLEILGGPVASGRKATVFGAGDHPVNFVAVEDVAQIVERVLLAPELTGATVTAGGPDNLTLDEVIELVASAAGRQASTRHIPVPMLKAAAAILRPVRPDFAGLMEAAVDMATADTTFAITDLTGLLPGIRLTRMAEVVDAMYGPRLAGARVLQT
jgi:NADH dehydrogenase